MKNTVYYLILAFFAALLLFSGWKLTGLLLSYKEGQDSYESLEQFVSFETREDPDISDTTAAPEEGQATIPADTFPTAETAAQDESTVFPEVDFEGLSQINPDIVGWLYIPGADISYPVVQGSDNDYYLNRLFDGTRNSSGSIFLDAYCASDFSDRHSIIYGHHMKDMSMFTRLMNYKSQAFYNDHPEALLMTPRCNYRIRFFSGYVSSTWTNAWELDFENNSFEQWLKETMARSCFIPADSPSLEDSVITLSTCSYEFDTAKFVLHGYIAERIEKDIE